MKRYSLHSVPEFIPCGDRFMANLREGSGIFYAPLLAYRWWWGFFVLVGGKENPHQSTTQKLMGAKKEKWKRVSYHAHPWIHQCKPDAKKKAPTDRRTWPMGDMIVALSLALGARVNATGNYFTMG